MLQVFRQRLVLEIRVVTQLMLPFVAEIACDGQAVVLFVAAHANYLVVVVLRQAGHWGDMAVMSDSGAVDERMMGEGVTMSSRDRVGGLCHAIATEEVRIEGRLK